MVTNQLLLRCRFEKFCTPYNSFVRINPSAPLILDGVCLSGCEYASTIDYEYKIYANTNPNEYGTPIWTQSALYTSYLKSGNWILVLKISEI